MVHYPEKPICILYLCLLLFDHRQIFRYTVNTFGAHSKWLSKSGFCLIESEKGEYRKTGTNFTVTVTILQFYILLRCLSYRGVHLESQAASQDLM